MPIKARPRPFDPLRKPSAAMLRAARRAVIPPGASDVVKKAYRDAAMLREYWGKK